MKEAKELTEKEKKLMAKERGITVEKFEELFLIPPSSSDSLFQNIRTDEDMAFTSINMRMFRQEFDRDNEEEPASP